MKILLLTPPFVQLNTPYPATAQLAGFLRPLGCEVHQRDLSAEVAREALGRWGDEITDELIELLQGDLPPEAKHEAALHLDGVAERIRAEVDPDFGFSRYAERLGLAVPDFGAVTARLRRRSPVDRILEERTLAALRECGLGDGGPAIVGVTCPFPGTLLGAFRIAKTVRRALPGAITVLGGGYVNTELRFMRDRRVRRYFDRVVLDDGYANWMGLLREFDPAGGWRPGSFATPCFVKPDYRGLDMSLYFDMPETENPMHRLWSCGRWIKLQLARGCYWRRCAFCDVTLDYIKRFESPSAAAVADAMEALADELGYGGSGRVPGFHFTDEAIPPALARSLSEELLRRGFRCEWWGNVRFDSAYCGDLPGLMAAAGCIAVTGGLECASDRLLALMNKGITLASARRCLRSFARAGIMVHAYLMYAFPTQTEREAREALEYVRDRFADGSVQSAFFHRFALTVHSPVARDHRRFGIRLSRRVERFLRTGDAGVARLFAVNEIPYREPGSPDWRRIGRGLRKAVYNYMNGVGLDLPSSTWF